MANLSFMKDRVFVEHRDPQHAWLCVKRKHLVGLGILDLVSSFSYQNGQSVYLEEDVDAPLFIQAYEQHFGKRPEIRLSHNQLTYNGASHVRRYERFEAYPTKPVGNIQSHIWMG